MVLTLKAEDHFSLRISRQMFPCSSTFGWKHGVSNVMSGALYGYVSGNTSLSLYVSPSYYTAVGSCTSVWAWRAAGGGWWCLCVCACAAVSVISMNQFTAPSSAYTRQIIPLSNATVHHQRLHPCFCSEDDAPTSGSRRAGRGGWSLESRTRV